MAKGLDAQRCVEGSEFGPEVDKSIDILRESIRGLIKKCGAVTLSTDCFASRIEIVPSRQGMRSVDAVMNSLNLSLKKVFLDEGIFFRVIVGNKVVSIEKSTQYVADFERQVFFRKIENSGRIAIGELGFLKNGFPVNLYFKNVGSRVYVLISHNGNYGLDKQGFNQKLAALDGHKRINLSGAMDLQGSNHCCDVKIVARGSYAMIVSDAENSQFASLADYERDVLPLLEVRE